LGVPSRPRFRQLSRLRGENLDRVFVTGVTSGVTKRLLVPESGRSGRSARDHPQSGRHEQSGKSTGKSQIRA
jgi:hypothetical protein